MAVFRHMGNFCAKRDFAYSENAALTTQFSESNAPAAAWGTGHVECNTEPALDE